RLLRCEFDRKHHWPVKPRNIAQVGAVWQWADVSTSSRSVDSNEPRLSIRALRLRTGYSQRAFAPSLGVSPEPYRTWDRGRRPVPRGWVEKASTLVEELVASTEWPL